MGEVDAFGRGKFNCRDAVNLTLPPLFEILCRNFLCPYRQGLDRTFISAQQIIENIYGKFVLIFVDNDLVAALTQVIGCRVDSTLERLDCLIFLFGAPCVVPRLILKNQKEASCNRLMGADLLNKVQVVLLHQAALLIVLLRHFTAYCVQVAVDVGTPGKHFDLQFNRTDF